MTMDNAICILGAGHQGLAMAGYLALSGEHVKLWNRTAENITKVRNTRTIGCNGIISGNGIIDMASSCIEDVVSQVVLVTAPSNAHCDIARAISPYVNADMVIVLNPGRTFGAIEFAETLKKNGVKELPHIAETQTIVYTCRKCSQDSVTILALKDNVKISSIRKDDLEYICSKLPKSICPCFKLEDNYLNTTLSNVGMILHCAPVLMNIGWIESLEHNFKYYYDGISKSVADFIQKIDNERLEVARKYKCDVLSTMEWLKTIYKIQGEDLYECIRNVEVYKYIDAPPSIETRYILEDVPNGLVPIECLAMESGIKTPAITTIINLACMVYEQDFREKGRRYSLNVLKEHGVL